MPEVQAQLQTKRQWRLQPPDTRTWMVGVGVTTEYSTGLLSLIGACDPTVHCSAIPFLVASGITPSASASSANPTGGRRVPLAWCVLGIVFLFCVLVCSTSLCEKVRAVAQSLPTKERKKGKDDALGRGLSGWGEVAGGLYPPTNHFLFFPTAVRGTL